MPTPGVCQYCGVTDDEVDGNKLSWHDAERTCCSKYACVKKHHSAARIAERQREDQARRPKSRFAELIRQGLPYGAAAIQVRKENERAKRARKKGRAA